MSFIKNFNKLGLLKRNPSKVGAGRLGTSKWFVSLIVLLAVFAPSAQSKNVGSTNTTINDCVHRVVEGEIINNRQFTRCVINADQQLTGSVRKGVTDYLLSASDKELEMMAEVIVKADNHDSYKESTKDEFSRFILQEIESILASNA